MEISSHAAGRVPHMRPSAMDAGIAEEIICIYRATDSSEGRANLPAMGDIANVIGINFRNLLPAPAGQPASGGSSALNTSRPVWPHEERCAVQSVRTEHRGAAVI